MWLQSASPVKEFSKRPGCTHVGYDRDLDIAVPIADFMKRNGIKASSAAVPLHKGLFPPRTREEPDYVKWKPEVIWCRIALQLAFFTVEVVGERQLFPLIALSIFGL